ncbi:transcriptional regulator [Nocardioides anomalus]|uniref:Transcriptional regulator n=1 Tax=Nocardioides anomalus TaxID=2712223 RepID=A0A6G6WC69_9ACTN|nr:transcriptional regulator [Nocardioides anomalus]QIG42824.1 transcriptional regulator [Nocardioides anomalus]
MTRVRRWCVVAVGTLLLVATPVALRALPAAESDVSAARLLAQVRASTDQGWSGYAETEGTLQLPDADRFSDVGALFGEATRMRVWWRDADHWRVDRLLTAGETDLVHDGERTTEWDYEHAEATVSRDPDIRLPRTADLVPAELARRFLKGVTKADVSRIPAERVGGISAPGLRVVPSSELSSIDHVDLWADPDTGVPLRVEVYADDSSPAFRSTLSDFSAARPTVGDVSFTPTPSTELRYEDVLDIADAANQYAPLLPPPTAAGLPLGDASDGAVGVYGEGLTQAIAIPLRDREADALRDQLASTPGVDQDDRRTAVSVGPLSVVLTGGPGDGGWLLAGTLTRSALVRAADDVRSGFVYTGDGR